MNLSTHAEFGNIMHGSLKHFGSLSYTDLPNVDMFHHTVSKKTHSLLPLPVSSESL